MTVTTGQTAHAAYVNNEFFKTPVRRLGIVRAHGLAGVALVMGTVGLTLDLDPSDSLFCFGCAAFCLLLGGFIFYQSRRAEPDALVTQIPALAPVPEQVRFYRHKLWASAIVFPALSVWVASELNLLESGAAKQVYLWGPLVPIYEHLGYWPAVLSPLVIGAICSLVFKARIRRLTSQALTDKP